MASQRIIIAKIGGEAGLAVNSRFHQWFALRSFDDPNEWSAEQWPAAARQEIDAFVDGLRSHGHELPVVYFRESVDFWSMGDVFRSPLSPTNQQAAIEVHSDRYQVWCSPLPDGGLLADSLRKATSSKRIQGNSPQESQWFTAGLLESVMAWNGLVEVASVVVVREVLGGLVEDFEVEASLKDVPAWINES